MIELKHVTFGYNKKQMVLQDINITIPDGENVGILGESGCGKSTLANCIFPGVFFRKYPGFR